MWKHVLPPVVLVIIFWVTISFITTLYISYTDQSHQQILRENVASIEAASDLQVACWQLIGAKLGESESAGEFQARLSSPRGDLADALKPLHSSATTEREAQLMREIEVNLDLIDSELRTIDKLASEQRPTEHSTAVIESSALRIAETSHKLRVHNGQIIKEKAASQQTLLSRMLLVRNMTLLLGPIVGVVLGWRITTRLQRRVSTLAITLRSAASNTVYTVGEYSLRGATDLHEVQQLSERVIAQMQEIGRNLERAELEIIQSERLAAVGELAAGIAHELRNPLTSVKLLLQHAAIDEDKGAISISNMELILSEITRMESTIQGLLDFARPATLSCRIHDICVPLQRAVTLVSGRAIASRVKIDLHPPAGPLLVNGDIEQIHLVFVNLLINAVESIQSGGAISIEASRTNADRSVSVTIRDTGCGIPDEVMKRLFEPFATTKERGTGLGLALCHRIVTNHHGTISGTNIPTGGAVFRVDFPCVSALESQSRLADLQKV